MTGFVGVSDLVAAAAQARPTAPAIVDGDRVVTYQEFAELVSAIAGSLESMPAGSRVGIYGRRSPEVIAAFLACLALGICYVPVDVAQPPGRIAELLKQAEVHRALAGEDLAALSSAAAGGSWPRDRASGELLAYIMFTSGSTGQPKGVMISQANLATYVTHALDTYDLRPSDRVYQVASLGFDWSVSEILPTLAAGATVVLRSDDALTSASQLAEEFVRYEITMVGLPTAAWHALSSAFVDGSVELPETVRHITIGGEQALVEAVRAWITRFNSRVRLLNSYGPTECTVEATTVDLAGAHAIDVLSRDAVPVGKPLPNASIYVLDDSGTPVGHKVEGRVFIGGPIVGQGYYQNPDATRRSFRPDPFSGTPGARMYDTGDIGYWNDHDELVFVGRADNQVKVGGYRVELEEIEYQIGLHESVREAAVVLRPDNGTLCAYVSLNGGTVDDVRRWLSDRVPVYLIPTHMVVVGALPRTLNDKIDRKALAALPLTAEPSASGDSTDGSAEDADELEARIAAVWARVLGLPAVRPEDDFFHLGGHSLLAMRLVGQLKKQVSPAVQLRDLLEARTVRGLADRVKERA